MDHRLMEQIGASVLQATRDRREQPSLRAQALHVGAIIADALEHAASPDSPDPTEALDYQSSHMHQDRSEYHRMRGLDLALRMERGAVDGARSDPSEDKSPWIRMWAPARHFRGLSSWAEDWKAAIAAQAGGE